MEEEKPKKKTIYERRKEKRELEYGVNKRTFVQKTKVIYNTRGKVMNYNRTPPKEDYLKYYRIVRYWACKYYNISFPNLEIILFLHSEGLFTENYFEDYAKICGFTQGRFDDLRKDGWVVIFKRPTKFEVSTYELSKKARNMVFTIYRKLNGLEPISERHTNNPLFMASAGYAEKQYAKAIIDMNKKNAKERYPGIFKEKIDDNKYVRNGLTLKEYLKSKRNLAPE